MIPTKPDDATFERYVSNIISAWNAASPADHAEGRQWYRVAHDLAEIVGDGDVRTGAGVIAALSPMTPWERNEKLAREISATRVLKGHLGSALAKVARIMAGEDPMTVLPMDAKTGHFYRNIADPDDPDPVTIDRHAHDVAVGESYGSNDRGLSSKTRYATLAHAYREAARRLGETAPTVQPVTWVYWRRTHGGDGS